MSIPIVEHHYIKDLSILDEVNDFVDNTDWYVVAAKPDGPSGIKVITIKSKIMQDGSWPNQKVYNDKFGNIDAECFLTVLSIIRQPYGWNDLSTERRAPAVYKVFQYINKQFFDNSFTLDGIGEEVSGSRHLWYDEAEKDIPNWGKDFGPNGRYDIRNPTPIWTAYANGSSKLTRRYPGRNNNGLSNGAHRDWFGMWDDPQDSAVGCYTLLVNLNYNWKYSEANELIFYETVPPSENVAVHESRGFGVGRPTQIFGMEPGLVILYPATAIHVTNVLGRPLSGGFSKRLAFRVRRKES